MAVCNHDCFHCQFPDCIDEEITEAEAQKCDERDKRFTNTLQKQIWALKNRNNYIRHRDERLQKCKEYYQENLESIKEKQHNYYLRHKEEMIARNQKYRQANLEKRKQYDHERYLRKKKEKANGEQCFLEDARTI